VFGTTPEPLLGANPPKPRKRPPLNGKVPCETQETPDLRTQAAPPPPQHTVDTNTPTFKAREALAQARAVKWLQKQLEVEGLQNLLKVTSKDATSQLLSQIAEGGR
jgi:hypothetical protein